MKRKTIAGMALGLGAIFAMTAKDEIIMKVNGVDVPRSEFEYLYHKNQQQQVDPQTLEEYAEMFKIYKLKVADALREGLDTTAEFKKEMRQYQSDLAKPYMTDSVFLNRLVKEAYDRSREEVETFHIMIPKGRSAHEMAAGRQRIDSIRNLVLAGEDFGKLAAEYSIDKGSNTNGGRMGYVAAGHLPYSFEKAAFELKPGEISEVVESPQAFHILKGGKHRPTRGKVLAEHIMKMVPADATPAQEAAAKASIDSILNVVKANPEKFEQLAMQLSDDKGSGRNGGKLNWFEAGMMVEPFDSAAFAMNVGEISAPVRSRFGWHIIRKLDAKAPATLEEMKPEVLQKVTSPMDERSLLIRKNLISNLAKKHKGMVIEKNVDQICAGIAANGLDSVWFESAKDINSIGGMQIAKIGKKGYTLADMITPMQRYSVIEDGNLAAKQMRNQIEAFLGKNLIDTEEAWLETNEPDYANLLKEYREGSLLYEASVRRVWDKASKDTEGLEKYFETHRSDYQWKKPHVKGLLVQAANDSVADEVRERLKNLPKGEEAKTIRTEFKGKASAERILAEQGQNPMVDNLVFGGPEVQPSNKNYTRYFLWDEKVIDAPESAADVKGLVTSDYQNQLESDWVEELKARYPVEIYQKVLKKVK